MFPSASTSTSTGEETSASSIVSPDGWMRRTRCPSKSATIHAPSGSRSKAKIELAEGTVLATVGVAPAVSAAG
jgi:hypothetical protein